MKDATGTSPRTGLMRNIPDIRITNNQTTVFAFMEYHPKLFSE
jgi:hypothetical protein